MFRLLEYKYIDIPHNNLAIVGVFVFLGDNFS